MGFYKVLYLLRHGEATLSSGAVNDFNRTLSKAGVEQLERLAKSLKFKGIIFDMVICSASNRTLETMEIISKEIEVKNKALLQEMYEATSSGLLELIVNTPDEIENLLLVGHNPSISAVLSYLSGENFISLKPGMMAIIRIYQESWANTGKNTGTLVEIMS